MLGNVVNSIGSMILASVGFGAMVLFLTLFFHLLKIITGIRLLGITAN